MSENDRASPAPPTTYRGPPYTDTSTSGSANHTPDRVLSPHESGTPAPPSPYLHRMGLQVDEQPRLDGTYNMPTSTFYQSGGYLERALASHEIKSAHLAYLAEADNDPTGVVEAARVFLPESPPSERAERLWGGNEGCGCERGGDGLPVGGSEVAEWPILSCGICGARVDCVDPWRHDMLPGRDEVGKRGV